jgi:hypothetical protein
MNGHARNVVEMDAMLRLAVLLELSPWSPSTTTAVEPRTPARRAGEKLGERGIPVADLERVERAEMGDLRRRQRLLPAGPDLLRHALDPSGDELPRHARRRDRPLAGGRRVRIVRLHVVQVGEEAVAAGPRQPAEERRVHLLRRKPGAPLALPAALDERLEAAREAVARATSGFETPTS